MIVTESTHDKKLTQQNLLDKVISAITKGGRALVHEECFDIKSGWDEQDYMTLRAFYRMLKYCLACDWCLTDEYLEKMNLYLIRR